MKTENIVQFVKFGVVGVSNTAVDWVVYFILTGYVITDLSAKPFAKAIAFIVAVINSYIWNTVWTFRKEYQKKTNSKKAAHKNVLFVKFAVVSLIGWAINYFVFKSSIGSLPDTYLTILGKTMNLHDIFALVFASAAATFWNFFGNKLWTFKK